MDWNAVDAAFAEEAQCRGWVGEVIAECGAGEIRGWTSGNSGPVVYLSAGIHGDEPAGPLAVLELMRAGVLDGRARWAVVPALNPDGLRLGTRGNADGLDLNRDYLSRMTAEVKGHVAWLESLPVPDLFLSLHEDWEARGFYLYEIRHEGEHPLLTRSMLEEASSFFSLEEGPHIDGHAVREAGWIFHGLEPDEPQGWPEAIHVSRLGCPLSYTLETPSHADLAKRVDCHVAVVSRLLSLWLG